MGKQARRVLRLVAAGSGLLLLQHCSSPADEPAVTSTDGGAGNAGEAASLPGGGHGGKTGGGSTAGTTTQTSGQDAGGSPPVGLAGGGATNDSLGGGGDGDGGAASVPTVLRCEKRGDYCHTTADCHYSYRCENERCVSAKGVPCTPDLTTQYEDGVAADVHAPECGVAQFCRGGQCADRPSALQTAYCEDAIPMAICPEDWECVLTHGPTGFVHSCEPTPSAAAKAKAKIGGDCAGAACAEDEVCVRVPVTQSPATDSSGGAGGAAADGTGGAASDAWLDWPSHTRPSIASTDTCSKDGVCWIADPNSSSEDLAYQLEGHVVTKVGGDWTVLKTFNDTSNIWPPYVDGSIVLLGTPWINSAHKASAWDADTLWVCNDDHLWQLRGGTWNEIAGGPDCWMGFLQVDGDGRLWLASQGDPFDPNPQKGASLWVYDGQWHPTGFSMPLFTDFALRGHDAWLLGAGSNVAYRLNGDTWDAYTLPATRPPGRDPIDCVGFTTDQRPFFGSIGFGERDNHSLIECSPEAIFQP